VRKKIQTHSILTDRKPLENSSWKSLQWLALQSCVSGGSAWTATKLLHIPSYKFTVVLEIKPVDYEKSDIM
jgi:hypothetical protein